MSGMLAFLSGAQVSTGWLLVPLLVVVMLCDLRLLRIPNWLVLLFLVVFLATVPFQIPGGDLALRVVAGVVVFALCLGAFALRVLGGGDVKLLAVLVLFVPPPLLAPFALLLSGAMILSLVALALIRRRTNGRAGRWRGLTERRRFPLGLPIGLAGLGLITLQAVAPGLA